MIYCFGLAAFCIAWLIPGHYFPWPGFQQETAAAVGALLLAIAALGVNGHEPPASAADRNRSPAVGRGAHAAMVHGPVPYLGDAALSSMYLGAFALTIVAATALARRFNDTFAAGIFAAILVGAIISAGIGWAQWLQVAFDAPIEHLDVGGRVYANFTQPNHLASLLGMGLVAAIWLFETRRVGRFGTALLLAYLGFGVVMTQSRAGWAFVAMLALWWALGRRNAKLRTTGFGVGASALGFVAMTDLWTPLNALLDSRPPPYDRGEVVGGRSTHRATLWDAAWLQPWLGWGWDAVGAANRPLRYEPSASHEWTSFSHNLMLDLWLWNGGPRLGGLRRNHRLDREPLPSLP